MPGRPKFRQLTDILENLGEEWIYERIEDGRTLQSIADELAPMLEDKQLGVRLLRRWKDADEDRQAKWSEAFKHAAHAYASQGLNILDQTAERPGLTSAHASLANSRAQYRFALAKVMDRATFGDAPTTQIVLNANDLHLTAIARSHDSPSYRDQRETSPETSRTSRDEREVPSVHARAALEGGAGPVRQLGAGPAGEGA